MGGGRREGRGAEAKASGPLSPPSRPLIQVACGVLVDVAGKVLIAQRPEGKIAAGKWEFPGGKIEPGESPEAALARELNEELGIEATIGSRVTHIRHNYRHGGAVDLQFYAVHEFSKEIENRIFQQVRWVKLEDLTDYKFLAADRGLIKDLAAGKLL